MAAGSNGGSTQKKIFRGIAWLAVIIVTLCLTGLSVTGAWYVSNENPYFTGAVVGVEMIAFISLTMIVYAANRFRRIVGWGIFVFAVGVCIFNAERAMKVAFEMEASPAVLEVEADNLDARALKQESVSDESRNRNVDREDKLLEEIADLEVERRLMVSGNVRRAQERLCALGEYPCDLIDGVRADITNDAMDARADAIRRLILRKEAQVERIRNGDSAPSEGEAAPSTGTTADVSVSGKADELRREAAQKRALAKQIRSAWLWIIPTLLIFEAIRSLVVWAFLMDDTMVVTDSNVRETEAGAEKGAVEAENALKNALAGSAIKAGIGEDGRLYIIDEDGNQTVIDPKDLDGGADASEENEPADQKPEPGDRVLKEEEEEEGGAPSGESDENEVDAATLARRRNLQKGRDSQEHKRDAAKNVAKVLVKDER